MVGYRLFPFVRLLGEGKYLYGFAELATIAATLALSAHLFGVYGLLVVGTLTTFSLMYRECYATYRRKRAHELETGATTRQSCRLHTSPPAWWIPVINWPWMHIVCVAFAVSFLAAETEVALSRFLGGGATVKDFLLGLYNPRWVLLPEAISVYAKQTVEIALLGTLLGCLIALPVSLGCASNLTRTGMVGTVVYYISRSIMVVVRAVPTFLLGLVFVALVGLGPFPGVLAITVFSTGVMVKLFSESIEAIDNGPLEAVRASGGNWLNMVRFGVLPQAIPVLIAQLLYCAEINVHSATVLGLIGAEGIGLPIHEYLSALAYDAAAVYIIVTIAMTVLIDFCSAYVRQRII